MEGERGQEMPRGAVMRIAAVLLALVLCSPVWAVSPLDASVIVRGFDARGTQSVGSGTAIDATKGYALIITAGHVVRDLGINGKVRVSFHDGQTVDGLVKRITREPDIGLIQVKAVPPALATVAAQQVKSGETVNRVGMFGMYGGKVNCLNRYQGAPNIETSGAAIEGDSGGGVFNLKGELVGVCSASDFEMNETIVVGLEAIHSEIATVGVKEVGCCWVRDAYGNWVKRCDNQAGQQPSRPVPAPPQPPAPQLPVPSTEVIKPIEPTPDQQAQTDKFTAELSALHTEIAALKKQVDAYKECNCGDACAKVQQELNARIETLSQMQVAVNNDVTSIKQSLTPNYDAIAAEVAKRLPPINMRVSPDAPYQAVHPGSYVTLPLSKTK